MRKQRTIYFNDARHYYLFVFEPPMRLEDARAPVDEVSGTAVDTFVYGVSRADGLFYPSRVGLMFGDDLRPFQHVHEWRAWENMHSLIARGLDPLTVLVDRAHEKGMDFIASLRMGAYGGMAPEHAINTGGRGFVHPEVRDHQRAILKELATRYAVEGVEMDFAASPGGCPVWLRTEDVGEYTPVMTDFVRETAEIVRGRPGGPALIGARVYPTEELNLKTGLDVRTCFGKGWSTSWFPCFTSISYWMPICRSAGSYRPPTTAISPSTACFNLTAATRAGGSIRPRTRRPP